MDSATVPTSRFGELWLVEEGASFLALSVALEGEVELAPHVALGAIRELGLESEAMAAAAMAAAAIALGVAASAMVRAVPFCSNACTRYTNRRHQRGIAAEVYGR